MNANAKLAALGLVFLLGTIPGYAVSQCSDSPQTVVLPDCTTVSLTTCYCEASDPQTGLTITITDLDTVATTGTLACNGTSCAPDGGDLAAGLVISSVVPRTGQAPDNSTPAPKGSATVTGTTCPSAGADTDGESCTVDVDLDKKNNHYDIILKDGSTEICRVGFNVHTQSCGS